MHPCVLDGVQRMAMSSGTQMRLLPPWCAFRCSHCPSSIAHSNAVSRLMYQSLCLRALMAQVVPANVMPVKDERQNDARSNCITYEVRPRLSLWLGRGANVPVRVLLVRVEPALMPTRIQECFNGPILFLTRRLRVAFEALGFRSEAAMWLNVLHPV